MRYAEVKANEESNPSKAGANKLGRITDDAVRLVIPVGPCFQVDAPAWSTHITDTELNTSRWLGTQMWPIRGISRETNENVIGKGRLDSCPCVSPGSIECIKRHVIDKKGELQYHLRFWKWESCNIISGSGNGTIFWKWKFDMMGEYVSKLWNLDELKKFALFVKTNPTSKGKNFLKPAFECLQSQCRENIGTTCNHDLCTRLITCVP